MYKLQYDLNEVITFVFKLEKWFISEFLKYESAEVLELVSFYMASERCAVTVLLDNGEQVITTVITEKVLDWYHDNKEEVR